MAGKKGKAPRTTAFTARELIVELAKFDPSMRVSFVGAVGADPRFPDNAPVYPVISVDGETTDFESGSRIVSLRSKATV